MTDVATALTGSLAKNGETVWTGAQDANGVRLILDADADTSITADTDDQIDIEIAGTDAVILGHQTIADGSFVDIDPAAITLDATESYHKINVGNAAAVTVPTGTTTTVSTMRLTEPNIVATGTLTNAATLYIPSAPTEATNNYAIWVDAGRVRFDDTEQSGVADAFGYITSGTTATAVGVASVSSTGTGVNTVIFDNAADTADEQVVIASADAATSIVATVFPNDTITTTIRTFTSSTGAASGTYPIHFARFLYT